MFFYTLTNTRFSLYLVAFALSLVYMVMPFFVNYIFLPSEYFLKLSLMTFFSVLSMFVGYYLPLVDFRFRASAQRLVVNANTVHFFVWVIFLVFLFVTLYTAPAIPLVSAMLGASSEELSAQRGAFLKGREGAEVALIYISTIFMSAFLPYSLARMFLDGHRLRYLCLLVFFGYSLSFLQKALFLNALLPLLYVASQRKKISLPVALFVFSGGALILYVVTLLAMGGSESNPSVGAGGGVLSADFYSAKYLPDSAVDHLIWRAVSVPMFTASDTLLVLDQQFNNEPLYGATSGFFASLFSLDRVFLEKLVFEHEWGWNETANSNAVYFTEGFANLGWFGVWLYSFFVGQTFRWFRKSEDHAFKSLWLIFFLGLFTSGLIGTLLSNGYILMFAACLFLKVKSPREISNNKWAGGV
ncbi:MULTISPECIES: hypothetical protein [Pseudomonas]|uniref:hypothetical protein n=1 Tax=Pseudomonas TaxID=286 RepID=UPI001BE7AF4C|nr:MULTISPECIES: hypothetical protein [Pseudomonas]MBT2342224.1 hypothetical protein [Pseudomonas fluorescens]MCD4528999.1 hypothetical protein [Pseudomonas sp. C3-2018]